VLGLGEDDGVWPVADVVAPSSTSACRESTASASLESCGFNVHITKPATVDDVIAALAA